MYNMRQHRNIHLGKGLHTCRYCGKDFTHKHIWEVRIKAKDRCSVNFSLKCANNFPQDSRANPHRGKAFSVSALSEGLRRQEQLQQPQEALRYAPQQSQSNTLNSESITILFTLHEILLETCTYSKRISRKL